MNPITYRNPAERNIAYDDVTIKVPDGVVLKGYPIFKFTVGGS